MSDSDTSGAGCILLTDHPWPDLDIETSIVEGAGYRLIAGPEVAGSAVDVEGPVASCSPLAIVTCWAPVSRRAIEIPSELKIVARLGVGLDNIDVEAKAAELLAMEAAPQSSDLLIFPELQA